MFSVRKAASHHKKIKANWTH